MSGLERESQLYIITCIVKCMCVCFSNSMPFSKAELTSILKFGAEELFKEEDEDEEPQVRTVHSCEFYIENLRVIYNNICLILTHLH